MWQQVRGRLRSWREVFWGKALVIGTTLWVTLGAWDLIKSELLPEKYQSWTVVAVTPHFRWQTWGLALLFILLAVLLEGSHAAIQKRDKANVILQSKMAKQKVGAASSTTMMRDWPRDWKLAEDGFRRYEKSSVRADWFRDGLGPVETWSITGDRPDLVNDVRALCLHAGKLLIVSPMCDLLPAELRTQSDDADRWLYFLTARYGLEDRLHGTSTVGGQTYVSTAGSIRRLAETSACACIECGAQSFPARATSP